MAAHIGKLELLWAVILLINLIRLPAVASTPRYFENPVPPAQHELAAPAPSSATARQGHTRVHSTPVDISNLPEALKQFSFNSGDTRGQALSSSRAIHDRTPHSESGGGHKLADIAVVVTVDGAIHAIRRDSGLWVWSLHDENESAQRQDIVKTPLVKSSNGIRSRAGRSPNATAQTSTESSNPGTTSFDNGNGSSSTTHADIQTDEDDEVYIIEPHSAGDIYVYQRSTGKLQKLPLSVTELVGLSPFKFSGDVGGGSDDKLFVGKKESKLVGVDLQSGKLVGVFGPEAGWCEWQQQPKGNGKKAGSPSPKAGCFAGNSDGDCEVGIEDRPWDLLYLGRTDYHISIYSKAQGLLQTLTYTSYGPSTLNTNANHAANAAASAATHENPWSTSPDGRYIQSMHDGSLVCFQTEEDGLQWSNRFSQPVVAVFDVAFPGPEDAEDEQRTPPILFPHPHQAVHSNLVPLQSLPPTTFVGRVSTYDRDRTTSQDEGANGEADELFAMSNTHFPLIAFAPGSSQQSATAPDEESRTGRSEAILGNHRLEGPIVSGRTIEGNREPLGIEAAPVDSNASADAHKPSPTGSELGSDAEPPLIAAGRQNTQRLALPIRSLLLLAVCFISAYVFLRRKRRRTLPKHDALSSLKTVRPTPSSKSSTKSASSDSISSSPSEPKDVSNSTLQTELTPFPVASIANDKELPALPIPPKEAEDETGEAKEVVGNENDESDDDDVTDVNKAPNNKKKGRRRKRGKRNGGATPAPETALSAVNETRDNSQIASRTQSSQKEEHPKPDSPAPAVVQSEPTALSQPQVVDHNQDVAGRIGGLQVSESIIGYGSHGTVVLKGTFQGRAVAVKRLLKDFVTVASHEVKLLQESDDHSNVIRYFCKEQHENFLYIALELCPASLYEMIDSPASFPTLVSAFDPIKALKQITKGLAHLHKLKIIHRDLKPQNILIAVSTAPPKRVNGKVDDKGSATPTLRMVISDFGLCKKLDLDESSFLQSVRGGGSNAPGSFGYRAPEVLRGEVDANDLVNNEPSLDSSMSSSNGGSTNSTSTLNAKSASTAGTRKLTRSIDIFSLGCIFYFVLTLGDHPFGSRYEREVNILNDKISLGGLSVMTEGIYEAQEMIRSMCSSDPYARPTAQELLLDPMFWAPAKSLHFLCDASDRFEIMEKDAPAVLALEDNAADVVGVDWLRNSLDRNLVDNLGKYRKYDGGSVRDLLRVLRNKKHHFQDLPENVRKSLGEPPVGFLAYFTKRFPKLLLHVHSVVKSDLQHEAMFSTYFEHPDDG